MISGDVINTLDLLPNTELNEVVNYIYELRRKRSQEEAETYKTKLINVIEEANKTGIYFTIWCSQCGENVTINSEAIKDIEVCY